MGVFGSKTSRKQGGCLSVGRGRVGEKEKITNSNIGFSGIFPIKGITYNY